MLGFLLGALVCWLIMKTPLLRDWLGAGWDGLKAQWPVLQTASGWLHQKLGGKPPGVG